jgi:hypothetical protein
MDDFFGASAIMQIVDILGDEREASTAFTQSLLQPRQREVRRIRRGAKKIASSRVIKGVNF